MDFNNLKSKFVNYLKNKIFVLYKKQNNKIALYRNNYGNYILDGSGKKIKDLVDQKKQQYLDLISKFLVKCSLECNNFPIDRVIANLDNVEIIMLDCKPEFKSLEVDGYYDSKGKTIYLSDSKIFIHEFLHFVSDKSNNKENNCGFSYSNEEEKLGYGLNEGYTELLLRQHFNNSDKYKSQGYDRFCLIAQELQNLLGKDIMDNIYFNGNTFMIIDELSLYMDKEAAISIIKDTDKAFELLLKIILKEYSMDDYNNYLHLIVKNLCILEKRIEQKKSKIK